MTLSLKKAYYHFINNPLTIPDVVKPAYLPALDGLRAVAIIIVIAAHFLIKTVYVNLILGPVGVDIFFVISGFLITTLLLKEKATTGVISLKNFYIRRFFRIIPVAYLFILVVVLLDFLLPLNVPKQAFVTSALFVQNIPKVSYYNWYIQHYWSLSVEEQFYITFPFLMAYSIKKYTQVIILVILGVVVIEYLGFNNVGAFKTNAVLHIASFVIINLLGYTVPILIGSLVAVMLFKGLLRFSDTVFNRYLSLLLFIIAFLVRSDSSMFCIPYSRLFIFPALIAIVIVLNLNNRSVLSKLLNNPVLIYIGKLSYSLYIWQQLFSNPEMAIIYSNSFWLCLAAILIVSMVSYHFFERPFLKLKSTFAGSTRDKP